MTRLRRAGRENAIKEAIERRNDTTRFKMHTKGELCRTMGIKSTSRIRDILNEMVDAGQLVGATTALDGFEFEIAIYGLPVYRQLSLLDDYGTMINGQWVTMAGEAIGYE